MFGWIIIFVGFIFVVVLMVLDFLFGFVVGLGGYFGVLISGLL